MSVTFQSKELFSAFTCPIGRDLLNEPVNLFPCCHKVNETAAEQFYGKMVGGSCELKDKTCVVCESPVTGYGPEPVMRGISAAMSAATVEIFGLKKSLESELATSEGMGNKIPYPFDSVRFKEKEDSNSFDGKNKYTRRWEFTVENLWNQALQHVVFAGDTDKGITLSVYFIKNIGFEDYLFKHGLSCEKDDGSNCLGVFQATTTEEMKTLFSIITSNNEFPYPQFYLIADFIKTGCFRRF